MDSQLLGGQRHKPAEPRWWAGLQARMAIAFVAVTVLAVLLLELLLGTTLFVLVTRLTPGDPNLLKAVKQTAQLYALAAAVQAGEDGLNPHSTFQPDRPASLTAAVVDPSEAVPYLGNTAPISPTAFALLVAPSGQVLASSYPA